jgi:maltose alpha-D-glucosyltransferase/alpha-amylase
MFESQFEQYIKQCRWFGGKGKSIQELNIKDIITLPSQDDFFQLFIIEIVYKAGQNELYLLPIAFSEKREPINGKIAKVNYQGKNGYFYEAVFNEKFRHLLLELINNNEVISSTKGALSALPGKKFKSIFKKNKLPQKSIISQVQQSNTSLFYEDVFFLKLYRRLQNGIHPEEQMTKYLTEFTDFNQIPTFAGSIEWTPVNGETITLALLQEFVPNKGDAWSYFCDVNNTFINKAIKQSQYTQTEELLDPSFMQNVDLLGKRTAQLHTALSDFCDDSGITAEPISQQYRQFLYESSGNLAHKVFDELNFGDFADLIKDDIAKLISVKDKIFQRIEGVKNTKLSGKLIRTHGDYHLGQVLFTGTDFIITDFEGEPTRPLSQRRQKHIALRDIGGMIRSFHYASYSPVLNNKYNSAETESLLYWSGQWYQYVSERFLNSYFNNLSKTDFLPSAPDEIEYLLDFYMLEKAIYELDYELHNRPSWLIVAAKGILQIISKKTEIHHFSKNI